MKKTKEPMSKWLFKILLSALIVVIQFSQVRSQDSSVSKTISKQFQTSNVANVEVRNKYGQVIINTWGKNEVDVKIKVTVHGKNTSAGEKTLKRVDFDFNKVNNYIVVETILDRKSGFFKDLWSNISDYSKTLLSRNKLAIDYELYVPENSIIKINNKFGDIFLGNLTNKCDIELSNGNLKADQLEGYANIRLSFGNAFFKYLKEADLELKVSDAEVLEADVLNLNSTSSDITIHKVNRSGINSRNDKFKITEVNSIFGKSSFSKIKVSSLAQITDLDMSYGLLNVSKINENFSKIQLTGKSTDFNLNFDHKSYFNASLKAKEDHLVLPKKLSEVRVDYLNDKEKFVSVEGTIGYKKKNAASVKIDAQKGDLKVFFIKNGD